MAVRIYLEESARRFETGVRELEVLGGFKLAGDGVPVRWSEAGVPGISWDGSRAQLSGAGEAQFFRGLGLLRERLAGGTAPFEQTEAPVFRGLGASFDLSRNAVMTVDALKRMLCRMALMGYNEAYLYTEDTYVLPEYPFFGYQRGRYGAEDLRALDGWAAALGIELIPCIQASGTFSALGKQRASAGYAGCAAGRGRGNLPADRGHAAPVPRMLPHEKNTPGHGRSHESGLGRVLEKERLSREL